MPKIDNPGYIIYEINVYFFSYSQIQRALQNSNDAVLALGSNFSSTADSHLVAVQRDEDTPSRNPMNNSDYETQAINIANKSRKGTC